MATFLPEFVLPLVGILNNTNISENSFEEIIEMIIKDEAVKEVEKKNKKALDNVLTAMNKDVEEGKEVDKSKVKAAEAIGHKLDKIRGKWHEITKNG